VVNCLVAASSRTMETKAAPRMAPMIPAVLNEAQLQLFETIVASRNKVLPSAKLFDESGALRGPWNVEVASPALGTHLERLADAVRTQNSLPPRLYEVAILAVGVHWKSQYEWFAHEALAARAGVSPAALALIKDGAPAERLSGQLQADEAAVYKLSVELLQTKRVSSCTYATTKQALGGDDTKMADLCMTIGCYNAVCAILNMFNVALPPGAPLPFPEPADAPHSP